MRVMICFCFVLVLFGVCHSFSSIHAGNYEITAGITQKGEKLDLDGKIKSGPKCKNLLITCLVSSTQGQFISISATTDYSGSGTTLYDGNKKVRVDRSKGFPSWNIKQTFATCND